MNKGLLFHWFLQDIEKNRQDYIKCLEKNLGENYNITRIKNLQLKEALCILNNDKEIFLPPSLPRKPDKIIPILRKHFDDNVTFISLILNYYFPNQYFFYHVSKSEPEVFQGFRFFAEIVSQFDFTFNSVGTNGFTRYLELNEKLMNFAHIHWPETREPQTHLCYLLYQGLGNLFLEKSDYHRYWIMATHEKYFWALDSGDDVIWSGRKEMQADDLVFMYRTAPCSAITNIYRVKDEPIFNPWNGYGGFDVNLKYLCAVEDITFSEMKNDPIIGQWGIVKRRFVGTVTEPIPHSVYNRLLTKISEKIQKKHHLEPEPVVITASCSGQFALEEDFEEEVIAPLLRRWGFKYKQRYICPFQIGSQDHLGRVDFYVSDQNGPLTLFEDKLRILNDKDLKKAIDQAKSYALLLGLPSFVVASPEGLWLYGLNKNVGSLVKEISIDAMSNQKQEEEFRNLLLKLRG